MLARWIPTYRAVPATGSAAPAERHFPVPIVAGHGVLAATTLVLVRSPHSGSVDSSDRPDHPGHHWS